MSGPLNEGNGDSDDAAEITLRDMDNSNIQEPIDLLSPQSLSPAFGGENYMSAPNLGKPKN